MNILITGGTGFIGTALCEALLQRKHTLVVKTREPEKAGRQSNSAIKWVGHLTDLAPNDVFDAVVNLAGEPIANKRWSATQKKKLEDSRIETSAELIEFFRRSEHKPGVFISGSAIGYYGLGIGDKTIDENATGDNSFSSQLCTKWEACALQAKELGIRTCLLRTGIVLGKGGGALAKMLPAFNFGLGGKIGSGKQWMPWIHLDDMVAIIDYCIRQQDIDGAINCTAPLPVTNSEFTKILGQCLKKPTFLSMPSFVVKVLMGQMGNELLLNGKNVTPTKLEARGFDFKYKTLKPALLNVLSK